jgi:hypothetical protein
MNIYELHAGGVIDGLIAERFRGHFAAHWSTDLSDAIGLWDQLAGRGWQCSLVHKPFEEQPDERWVFHGVNRKNRDGTLNPMGPIFVSFSARADTRELAIARGALASCNA